MKETMSSFDIAAVLLEITSRLEKARISNIYQTNPKTIILKLHKPEQPNFFLLIEAGKRIHLTWLVTEKPHKPPNFCMILRKHLKNSVVTEVKQQDFERIVTIKTATKNGEFRLISELFDEGNIILTNPKKEITTALTFKKMRDREILRNVIFSYPPSSGKNPLTLKRQETSEITRFGNLEIVKALTRFLGIGGLYAEEILLRAKIDKNTPCAALTETNIDAIYRALEETTAMLAEDKLAPHTVLDEKEQLYDVTPFPLSRYEKLRSVGYSSFNEALDEYYAKAAHEMRRERKHAMIEKEVEKYERIIEAQKKAMKEAESEIERNKRIGDTIYLHFHELQHLLEMTRKTDGEETREQIISKIEKEKQAGISPSKYFHALDLKQQLLEVDIDSQIFSLKLNRTTQVSAEEYYAKAKKIKKKLDGMENSIKETIMKIDALKSKALKEEEKQAQTPALRKIGKKLWYEKFRWFQSSDGFLVIGGKDAITNEIIIKKHIEPQDIVFHADVVGAPFVAIKTFGKEVPEQTLTETATFAAAYSRAWRQKIRTVSVYWVRPQQVSKTPPSGEYLGKGAFMIYGKKNFVRNVQLALAIGVTFEDDTPKAISGPKTAIAKQTSLYVDTLPGDTPSSQLARQIKQELTKKAQVHLQEKLAKMPLDEIQQLIPFGTGQLMR